MDYNGQDYRYCPRCGRDTDQQFSVVEENNESYTLFWSCMSDNCSFEELETKNKL